MPWTAVPVSTDHRVTLQHLQGLFFCAVGIYLFEMSIILLTQSVVDRKYVGTIIINDLIIEILTLSLIDVFKIFGLNKIYIIV